MPRIKYVDSANKEGEMDLQNVRLGDLVRFIADFKKVGDEVSKDEIGEVSAVFPEHLQVTVIGTRRADGVSERTDVAVEVRPEEIVVLVNDQDTRSAAMTIQDESSPEGATFTLPDGHQPGMVVPKGGSSCVNCRHVEARDDGPHCTSSYFAEWHGSSRLPVDDPETYCSDWYEPKGAGAEVTAERSCELGTLPSLWDVAAGVQRAAAMGANPFDSSMVAAELVRSAPRTAGRAANLVARAIAQAEAGAWRELLAGFGLVGQLDPDFQKVWDDPKEQAEIAEGQVLRQQDEQKRKPYQVNTGLVTWAIKAMGADFERFFGHTPDARNRQDAIAAVQALARDLRASVPDDERGTPEEEAAKQQANKLESAAAQLAAISDTDWTAALDWAKSLTSYQPPAPPPRPPVQQVAPAPAPAPPTPEPEPEPEPEPWTTRVPIGMPPGFGPRRVFADPGMRVYNKRTKEEGDVVGAENEDTVLVEVEGVEEPWDAMDTLMALSWKGPREYAPVEVVDAWRKERRMRLRGAILDQEDALVIWDDSPTVLAVTRQ